MIAEMNVTPIQPRNHQHTCKRCKRVLYLRVHRSAVVKTLLFWIPLKKYFCTNCLTAQYVVDKDDQFSNANLA